MSEAEEPEVSLIVLSLLRIANGLLRGVFDNLACIVGSESSLLVPGTCFICGLIIAAPLSATFFLFLDRYNEAQQNLLREEAIEVDSVTVIPQTCNTNHQNKEMTGPEIPKNNGSISVPAGNLKKGDKVNTANNPLWPRLWRALPAIPSFLAWTGIQPKVVKVREKGSSLWRLVHIANTLDIKDLRTLIAAQPGKMVIQIVRTQDQVLIESSADVQTLNNGDCLEFVCKQKEL
jgi:hypothetical protein